MNYGVQQSSYADFNLKKAKRAYSCSALGAVLAFAAVMLVQLAAIFLIRILAPEFEQSKYYMWVVAVLPTYVIGFPAGILLLKLSVPASPPVYREKLGFGGFCVAFCISMLALYGGNMIGGIVSAVTQTVFGKTSTDNLDPFLGQGVITIAFIAIIGPIFEELFFRKLVIDRVRVFGEKTAILASAFMFGLFHGNLQQFFYAFAVGVVFGYIYLRTGSLLPSTLLHILINLLGGVLAPWLSSQANISFDSPEFLTNPFFYALAIYGLLTFSIVLAGIVFLIVFRKRIHIEPAESGLLPGTHAKAVFLNAGMIIFIVIETISIVLSFFQ